MDILNRENVMDATDGDLSMEAMLYQSFLKTSATYMQEITTTDEAETKARALHSLKGLSLNMGAEALGDLCRRAETAPVDLATLQNIYQQTCNQMQEIIKTAE